MPSSARFTEMKHSGIEWVGNIPSHWSVKTLNQLVSQVKNKNNKLEEKNLLSLSYGKIKRKDINSSDGLLPASFDGYNIIEAGDIVLRLTDLQNDKTSLRVGLATERGIITSAYITLRPFDVKQSKYLYYLLHSFDIKKGFYGMGSGVRQGLNYGGVKELRITLPSQDEIEAVASYLDVKCAEIDEVILETKASIENYNLWKASVIFEAVTKGLDPNAEMKDSGIQWFKDVPKHWEIKKLKHCATITTGNTPPMEHSEYYNDQTGIEWIKPNNLLGLNGVSESKQKLTPLGAKQARIMPPNTVLVCCIGTIGKLGFVTKDSTFNQQINGLVFNETVYWKYGLYFMSTQEEQQRTLSTGNVVAILNSENQRHLFVTVPPYDEQQAIVIYLDEKCSKIDSVISTKQMLIESLSEYKQSLIYEVVTGKRKVYNP